jgi:hypothetical protein
LGQPWQLPSENSAHRSETAVGIEAYRGDWISAFKVTTSGPRGSDMQISSSPNDCNSLSTLVASFE